jgi:hypothetical protein
MCGDRPFVILRRVEWQFSSDILGPQCCPSRKMGDKLANDFETPHKFQNFNYIAAKAQTPCVSEYNSFL